MADAGDHRRRVRPRIGPAPGEDELEPRSIVLRGGPALPASLAAQYRAGNLCDIEIHVEAEVLMAHRIMLAGCSEYFGGLLVGGGMHMSEAAQQIELQEMSASTMRVVLDWIYDGKCTVPENSLFDLLAAADRLGMTPLHVAATWAIAGHVLDDSSCFDVWELASRLGVAELEEQAEQYALKRFEAVALASELRALTEERASRLLSSDNLIAKEEVVLDFLFAWARVHAASPTEVASLLSLVRFDLFLDPATARRAAAAPLLASQECMTVIACKLAEQVDPQCQPSPARRLADKYATPLSEDFDAEIRRKMGRVVREFPNGATFAHIIEGRAESRAKVIGPLSMSVVAKRGVFQLLLKKAFPQYALHKLFVNVTGVFFAGIHEGHQPSGVRVVTNSSTEAYMPPPRPPVCELFRFVPREMRHEVELAWADEMVHIDDAFISNRYFLEVSLEQAKVKMLNALWDLHRVPDCLLCTHDLPRNAVLAILQHIRDFVPPTSNQMFEKWIVMPHSIGNA